MITRETVGKEILSLQNKSILAELPTGFGKSKVALDVMKSRIGKPSSLLTNILVVVPRLILIQNWKDEFVKWGCEEYLPRVQFVTYVSFPKKLYTAGWDMIIFDEAHHLSARCRDAFSTVSENIVKNTLLLSATVSRDMRKELKIIFPDLYIYKITTKQAIQEEVLPDPRVFLIPLSLNRTSVTHQIVKNPSQKIEVKVSYADRWKWKGVRNRRIIIPCTQGQYYDDMSSMIDWYKRKMFNETFKNLFLRKSGERLKWLSDQKTAYVKHLLDLLDKERTLTFCNGIPQTEELGKYCINSSKSKKENELNLERFNTGRIKHITACNVLDEGRQTCPYLSNSVSVK